MWQIRERKGRKRWRSRGYQQFDRIVGREEKKRDERKREVGGTGRERKETGCRREEKERKETGRRGKERKGKERKGKERGGEERKGKERAVRREGGEDDKSHINRRDITLRSAGHIEK